MQIKKTGALYSLLIFALAYGIFFHFKTCQLQHNNAIVKTAFELEKQEVKVVKNSKNKEVSRQNVIISESRQQVKDVSEVYFESTKKEEKKIKEVAAVVKVDQKVEILDKVIPYTDTSSFEFTLAAYDSLKALGARYIIPPKFFTYKDSVLTLDGVVQLHGVTIDSLSIVNELALRIYDRKRGWLKSPVKTVEVINKNPVIKITGMNSLVLKEKISFWNKWLKPLVFAAAGFYLGKKIIY